MDETKEVRSGEEADAAEIENKPPKTKKKTTKKTAPKKAPETAPETADGQEAEGEKKPKGKTFQENKITDSETARERGHNGGVKSGEVRRAQRDARETIRYMLGRMTKAQNVKDNLRDLGFEQEEFSNMAALHGRLFTMAMGGNLEAYMTLMRMGGYEPEENRKERESVSADRRRDIEVDAKVTALGQKGENASLSISMNDEDEHDDVVIYMPQIASEESCQEAPETPTDETVAEGDE